MESTIFIFILSVKSKGDDIPLSAFLTENLNTALKDHAPEGIIPTHVSWHKDSVCSAFFEELTLLNCVDEYFLLLKPECGYLKIVFEAEEDLQYKKLEWMEWVIQKMHEEYTFIGSYCFYLINTGFLELQLFVKLFTPQTNWNKDDEIVMGYLGDIFPEIFDDYFYRGMVQDWNSDVVAKLLLQKEYL